MKVFVLASCYVDNSGYGETRTPSVFTSLKDAQNALQEEWDNIDQEALDETMDQSIDFTDKGYALVYFKDGSSSYYEIYEEEVK